MRIHLRVSYDATLPSQGIMMRELWRFFAFFSYSTDILGAEHACQIGDGCMNFYEENSFIQNSELHLR